MFEKIRNQMNKGMLLEESFKDEGVREILDQTARMSCLALRVKDVPAIELVEERPEFLGANDGDTVYVNTAVGNVDDWAKVVRHEVRHLAQMKDNKEEVKWWTSKEEYHEGGEFYFYSTIEMEARLYASHKLEKLTGVYSVNLLEKLYQKGVLLKNMKKLSEKYNVPEK